MKAYCFDKTNGQYVGNRECQLDPVRSKREGKEVFLLPGDSTWIAPPDFDPETQLCTWDDTAWTVSDKPKPEPEPEPEIPIPSKQREEAYNTQAVISFEGEMLTVTQASQKWQYYAAEGNTIKTNELTALIAEAKARIREQYPDE